MDGYETTVTYPYDTLDLVGQPMAFGDDYCGLEGRFRLNYVGVGQEHLADGDLLDGLPLRWSRGGWYLVPREQFDGLSWSPGTYQPAQMHLVHGIPTGERSRAVVITESPSAVDDLIERCSVTEFPGCPRQLYQNRAAISFGDELRGVGQPSHGSSGDSVTCGTQR